MQFEKASPGRLWPRIKRSASKRLLLLIGMRCVRIEGVECLGDPNFLTMLTQAVTTLHRLDCALLDNIRRNNWIIFSSTGSPVLGLRTKLLGIENGWLESGVEGIMANIVFAHFVAEGDLKKQSARSYALVKTSEWLVERGMSARIVDQFKN